MNSDNALVGLRPISDHAGGTHNATAFTYHIPATNATQVFIGQMVRALGASNTGSFPPNNQTSYGQEARAGNYQDVIPVVPGETNPILGVIVGFHYDADRNKDGRKHLNANEAALIRVQTDPKVIYRINADAAFSTADVGRNADITALAGNTTFGWSGHKLDVGTIAATATLPLRILGVDAVADNDPTAVDVPLLVRINNHYFDANTGV